jgi:hypothetical protein
VVARVESADQELAIVNDTLKSLCFITIKHSDIYGRLRQSMALCGSTNKNCLLLRDASSTSWICRKAIATGRLRYRPRCPLYSLLISSLLAASPPIGHPATTHSLDSLIWATAAMKHATTSERSLRFGVCWPHIPAHSRSHLPSILASIFEGNPCYAPRLGYWAFPLRLSP